MTTATIRPAPRWASDAERTAALRVLNDHHGQAWQAAMLAARWDAAEDQTTFARRLGVEARTLRRWEAGHYTWHTIEAYGRAGFRLIAMCQAANRGYAQAIGSPFYEIEDASIGHNDMARILHDERFAS